MVSVPMGEMSLNLFMALFIFIGTREGHHPPPGLEEKLKNKKLFAPPGGTVV